MYKCLHCDSILTPKRNTTNKYCDNKCQREHIGKTKVKDWLSGKTHPTPSIVSRYLKETYGYSCSSCGIEEWNDKRITLEIDHIDGNCLNNSPSNFQYLCPNCHSQTDTYKGKNKGKGRPKETKNYTIQRPVS